MSKQNTDIKGGINTFHATTRKAWRTWLQKNHAKEKNLWLIIYHKDSTTKSVYYAEAVEEALCFGWIDSKGNPRDDESYFLFFAQRKPKSNWSKLNRDRVKKLTEAGLMKPAGLAMIDLAKKSGTWKAQEEVDNLIIPPDLQRLFNKKKTAFKNFQAFAPSSKKVILNWLLSAKKPETRLKRIQETVALAEKI
jgi:uncharacterized protein YdeI (YjbR/CyaY-like superfamily)